MKKTYAVILAFVAGAAFLNGFTDEYGVVRIGTELGVAVKIRFLRKYP